MPLNANAITDIATVKSMIKGIGTSDDTILEMYINGASSFFENYCNTKFIILAITEVVDGSGFSKQIIESAPIATLTEVKYDFDTSSPSIQTIGNFNFNSKAGIIHSKESIFPEGWQNIQIKYTSGYGAAIGNLPADLVMACALQVEYYYKRDTADFSATFEEGFVLKAEPNEFAPRVKNLLAPFKRNVL